VTNSLLLRHNRRRGKSTAHCVHTLPLYTFSSESSLSPRTLTSNQASPKQYLSRPRDPKYISQVPQDLSSSPLYRFPLKCLKVGTCWSGYYHKFRVQQKTKISVTNAEPDLLNERKEATVGLLWLHYLLLTLTVNTGGVLFWYESLLLPVPI
jgi:hypothetical protein